MNLGPSHFHYKSRRGQVCPAGCEGTGRTLGPCGDPWQLLFPTEACSHAREAESSVLSEACSHTSSFCGIVETKERAKREDIHENRKLVGVCEIRKKGQERDAAFKTTQLRDPLCRVMPVMRFCNINCHHANKSESLARDFEAWQLVLQLGAIHTNASHSQTKLLAQLTPSLEHHTESKNRLQSSGRDHCVKFCHKKRPKQVPNSEHVFCPFPAQAGKLKCSCGAVVPKCILSQTSLVSGSKTGS